MNKSSFWVSQIDLLLWRCSSSLFTFKKILLSVLVQLFVCWAFLLLLEMDVAAVPAASWLTSMCAFLLLVTECTLRQLKLLCSQNLKWSKVFCNIVTLRPSMRSFLSMHGPFRSLFCFVRSVIGTLRFLLLCQQCTWRSVLYLVLYFSTCSIFYYPGN